MYMNYSEISESPPIEEKAIEQEPLGAKNFFAKWAPLIKIEYPAPDRIVNVFEPNIWTLIVGQGQSHLFWH